LPAMLIASVPVLIMLAAAETSAYRAAGFTKN
jgi:hypothetical protein